MFFKNPSGLAVRSFSLFQNGSGWIIDTLIHLRLCTVQYDPVRASSYIPLPAWIDEYRPGSCINVNNMQDECCFLYAVLCHYHHRDVEPCMRHLPSAYAHFHWELDMSGICFPTNIDQDLNRFEKQNPGAVNVFSLTKNKKIAPLRISTKKGDNSPSPLCHLFFIVSSILSFFVYI